MKVLAVQHIHGKPPRVSVFLQEKYRDADFICFPEYFMGIDGRKAHRYLRALSKSHSALVLGTLIEPYKKVRQNVTYLYAKGKPIGHYIKTNPTIREQEIKIRKGPGLRTFRWRGVKFGILICNDILRGIDPHNKTPEFNPAIFRAYRKRGVRLIFVPLISPLRRSDTPRSVLQRRAEFGRMARIANAYIIKVGGVGNLVREPVKGRSGAYDPRGRLLAQAKSEEKAEILSIELF